MPLSVPHALPASLTELVRPALICTDCSQQLLCFERLFSSIAGPLHRAAPPCAHCGQRPTLTTSQRHHPQSSIGASSCGNRSSPAVWPTTACPAASSTSC